MEFEYKMPSTKTLDEEKFTKDIQMIYMSLRRAMAVSHNMANHLGINLKEFDRNIENNRKDKG